MSAHSKPQTEQPSAGDTILALHEMGRFVAAMTDIKRQFVEAGWTDRGAEQMVHAAFSKQAGASE
ncbi:hypothetical protein [Microbacterium sp. cx-59]|uniref:hypothetical protein n=1 Tax=Microbacterium sp. cx-59 TaxID=2891207 RepID=UPI001E5E9AE0|nr:hypothetical protein [Microbacterium sp. cx-59]MCC4906952.1 hypothetical protein [Microbacterium sp. cx-59]